MTPRKLSESDKQQILELYRLPGETTSTLAGRYGVSNSTISRILKQSLSEDEYEALIQQKRSARSGGEETLATEVMPDVAPEPPEAAPEAAPELTKASSNGQLEMPLTPTEASEASSRRSRRRSSAPAKPVLAKQVEAPAEPMPAVEPAPVDTMQDEPPVDNRGSFVEDATVLEEILHEELSEELLNQEDLSDLDDDEDLDDDDLDDDFEEDELEGESPLLLGGRGEGKIRVQVLPIAEAPIPKTCYLVVDRASELIARPLKEFGDLGQIPEEEVLEKTLPVFDNHRVAKRFSNPRTQRVIKLPDGRVLEKTSSHLQAKGITRLLIDGQVYSLPPSPASFE